MATVKVDTTVQGSVTLVKTCQNTFLRTSRKPRNANKGWTGGHEGSTNILQVGAILNPPDLHDAKSQSTIDDAQRAVVLGR